MTRDDMISMAREAGFVIEETKLYGPVPCVDGRVVDDLLERFAALVAAAERQKTLQLCKELEESEAAPWQIIEAIRARGENNAT